MGHSCYTCLKILKWNMLKNTLQEVTGSIWKRVPPAGFTSSDRLCSDCANRLQTRESFEKEKTAKLDKDIERMKAEAAPRVKCYWCKKQKISNQFALRSKGNLEDNDTCNDCNKIINGLTSIRLRELISLESNNSDKIVLMEKLYSEASIAASQAEYDNSLLSGILTKGVVGAMNKDTDKQHSQNSANQNKASLELNLMDVRQESIRISNLIKNEKNTLAKEYFFNLDSNKPEPKVNSINTIKTNESDDPVQILKIRLAKGEITIDEFNKIKENLE
jgi:ribosomal protein L34E